MTYARRDPEDEAGSGERDSRQPAAGARPQRDGHQDRPSSQKQNHATGAYLACSRLCVYRDDVVSNYRRDGC